MSPSSLKPRRKRTTNAATEMTSDHKLTCSTVLRLAPPSGPSPRTKCPYASIPLPPPHYSTWKDRRKLTRAQASSSNPYPDVKSQKAFEKALLEKTAKQTGDILLFDGRM